VFCGADRYRSWVSDERIMTDAVLAALTEIRRAHETPADAIALSLSCEFLARAAFDRSELVRTLGLISPTGFEGWARDHEGGTRGQKWLHRTLSFRLWSRGLFRLLTTRAVIRKFLKKTWGSKRSMRRFCTTHRATHLRGVTAIDRRSRCPSTGDIRKRHERGMGCGGREGYS
jgi:pimeloyl-ACP methyl ester carboxylesterase